MKIYSPAPGLLALLVLALSVSLAGCCLSGGYDDTPTPSNTVPVTPVCPSLVDVQQQFGLSLGGTYGGATFAEYRLAFDSLGAIDVIPSPQLAQTTETCTSEDRKSVV